MLQLNRDELRRSIAEACRVLALQGLAQDILGHVSARISSTQLLVRARGPRERGLLFTTPADVHVVDLDTAGVQEMASGYAVPNELFIHTRIMSRRPAVQAVVHAHAPAVVTADLAGICLRPIIGAFNIPAMKLARDGIPVYRRSVLINRAELADEMVDKMGMAQACIMRGHGVTTTGKSVAAAVLGAINLETLARISLGVVAAGGVLTDLAAQDARELPDLGATLNEQYIWQYHLGLLDHEGLALE